VNGLRGLRARRNDRARPPTPPFRRKLLFEALEPRLLLSADLTPAEQLLLEPQAPLQQDAQPQSNINMAAVLQQQPAPRSIVFLDASLKEYQAQLGDADVVLLDAGGDGVAQITAYLETQRDVDAVHIVTHGAPGGVRVGAAELSNSTVASYAEQLATWRDALSEDADILLYGCSVGADFGFIENLAALTGADVAASDDLTGAAELGGDWMLEAGIGVIQASS
jgi:hypothetical protein